MPAMTTSWCWRPWGSCRSIDEAQLALLSRTCTNIRELTIYPSMLSAAAIATYLGNPSLFPQLVRLELTETDEDVLTNDVLLSICRSHPKLTHLSEDCSLSISLSLCAVMLSICHDIRHLLHTVSYEFVCKEVGRREDWCLKLGQTFENAAEHLPRIAFIHPINRLSIGYGIEDESLQVLAEQCRRLKDVYLCPGPAKVSIQSMQYFLEHLGSQLAILSLNNWKRPPIKP